MGQHEHAKAFAEINAIVTKAVPGQAVRVLSVDEDVNTDQHITQARQITPAGGRGTDMAKGIQTAAETRPAVIIVITDGYTPWPGDPTRGSPHRDRRAHSPPGSSTKSPTGYRPSTSQRTSLAARRQTNKTTVPRAAAGPAQRRFNPRFVQP